MDRDAHIIWQQKGSKSMEARVRERLHKILASHQPPPLSPETTAKIQSILDEAEKRYL